MGQYNKIYFYYDSRIKAQCFELGSWIGEIEYGIALDGQYCSWLIFWGKR